MAHILTGKVWSIDTSIASVTQSNVYIHAIRIRFTTAGAGSCVITANRPDVTGGNSAQEVLLDIKTTAASTAAVWCLDQTYTFGDQLFQGIRILTAVNMDTVYVVTCNPK